MAEEEREAELSAFGKQHFNVYLPSELVRDLKHAAIGSRRWLSKYVEEIFREHLGRRSKEENSDR